MAFIDHYNVIEALSTYTADAEEVGGGDSSPVRSGKRLPWHGPSPDRDRLDTVSLENALNGRATKRQPNVLECAAESCVPPRWIVARHGDHLLDCIAPRMSTTGGTTRRRAVVLGGDVLTVPA